MWERRFRGRENSTNLHEMSLLLQKLHSCFCDARKSLVSADVLWHVPLHVAQPEGELEPCSSNTGARFRANASSPNLLWCLGSTGEAVGPQTITVTSLFHCAQLIAHTNQALKTAMQAAGLFGSGNNVDAVTSSQPCPQAQVRLGHFRNESTRGVGVG